MGPIDRRTFLAGVAAATAGPSAASALATGVRGLRAPVPVWRPAPCHFCGVGCRLLVGTEAGRAGATKGDGASLVNAGLACAKGYFGVQALYGPDRLTRARVRRNGALVDVPLGEAVSVVADRLRAARATHGADAIAVYGSSAWSIPDAYVATKLFKGALGSNNVETAARLHGAAAVAALAGTFGLDGAPGCYEDIERADVIVLWDANVAETDPVLFSRILERKRRTPAVRIVDVATRTTRTSYACDRALLHRPHQTAAIAHGICEDLVTRGMASLQFIQRYAAFRRPADDVPDNAPARLAIERSLDSSWEEYLGFLRNYTPERVQVTAGLSADNIRWLASLFGDPTRTVLSLWGPSLNAQVHGVFAHRALYNVHLLTGKVASPGNGAMCLSGLPNDGCALHQAGARADALPGGVVTSDMDRRRAADIWGVPIDRINPEPGRHALELFRGMERGDVRFLWIQSSNPMVELPDAERYRRAARSGSCFIVASDAYPTATTEVADVILPSALWIERDGVTGNAERRLQYWAQQVEPPGDATSDAWLTVLVARRLGHGALFSWERRTHVEAIWEEYRRFHPGLRDALPSMTALRLGRATQWPVVEGRSTRWRYNTLHDPAADRAHGAYDFYGHDDHRAWVWHHPVAAPPEAPSAEYPFWLGAAPVLEHSGTGTLTRRIPALHRAVPRAYVEINRGDAETLGVAHGDTVRVTSRRGAIVAEARIDYRAQPPAGHVFIPPFDEDVLVHALMPDLACPVSGHASVAPCAVRLERVEAPAGVGAVSA